MPTAKPTAFGVTEEEFIFHTAKDFFITGLNKMNTLERPIKSSSAVYVWELSCPFTNISFGIELILKSFFTKHVKTHSLLFLYDSIDKAIQQEIENAFDQINYNFIDIALGQKPDPPQGNTSHEIITDALKRGDKSFEKFRYLHEFDTKDLLYFDSSTMARICHACLIVRAKQLNINFV
jgi:hypothetical protein